MPRDFSRTRRIEEQVRRELAELIRRDIKEPGLGMLSVSEVKVSSDLSMARVYISVLEDDLEVIDFTIDMLNQYAPKLRHLLGKCMHIRAVPQLKFIYDDLILKGNKMSQLINQAVDEDKQKADDHGTDTEGEDHG